jgi:hypothetical protein
MPVPRWLMGCNIIWALLASAWFPVLLIISATGTADRYGRTVGTTLLAVAAVATIGFGVVLGRNRPWIDVVVSAALGTGVLAVVYVVAMLAQPDDGGSSDNAAAVGLVILAPPALAVIALLLATGALVGRGLRWRRRAS